MLFYNYISRQLWYKIRRNICKNYQFIAINSTKQRRKHFASLKQLIKGRKFCGISKRISNYLQCYNSNCRNSKESLEFQYNLYFEADGDTYMYEAWSDDLDVEMEDVYQMDSSPLYNEDYMDIDEYFDQREEDTILNYNIPHSFGDVVIFPNDDNYVNHFNEIGEQQVLFPPIPVYSGLITSRPLPILPSDSELLLEASTILSQTSLFSSTSQQ